MPVVRSRTGLLFAIVMLGMSVPGLLGSTPVSAQEEPSDLCWRGRTGAECASFLITEFALGVAPKQPARRPPVNGMWELGAMRSITPSQAVGASLFVLHDDESRYLIGVRPRLRHWMGPDLSLDLGLGVILRDLRKRSFVVEVPSFTGRVGLDWADRLGVFAQLEVLRVERRPQANPELVGTQATVYAGVRFGADVGVLAGAIAAGVVHWSNRISS
jgi:hypothetical protein